MWKSFLWEVLSWVIVVGGFVLLTGISQGWDAVNTQVFWTDRFAVVAIGVAIAMSLSAAIRAVFRKRRGETKP